ncbi:MAG TPA: amino acid adenylation domain-containing protein, partial [Ktedonobacteraceae bacterium]|nr:amino acid adenylation domain-containing protein [Ktedonobacteraceae bacterium]
SLLHSLPQEELTLLCLEALEETLADQPVGNLVGGPVTASNLAYVMYTSGSTGQPKGIAITHGSIINLVCQQTYMQVSSVDVFLHQSSISFDIATFEVWGSLLNGASLVVAPAEQPSLSQMADLISQHQVSVLCLATGLFNQMVDLHLEGLRPLKYLLSGGEAHSVPHMRRAVAGLPNCRVINAYGPTEITTFACCYSIQADDSLDPSVPIGRAILRAQAYVLDGQLQPVPVGVVGELYLGGAVLARGYLNRPDLTAERFLPDPFSSLPGSRLYRTGDLVGAREDGVLLFIGRRDGQVKLRGFRIEYGEIEHWLGLHPGVKLAAAIVREDRPGDKRLVAYLARSTGETAEEPVAADVLREYLRARVPDYMLPAAFVWLEQLPLTPSGKVDRQALPAPHWGEVAEWTEADQPQTSTERILTEIWADVLGVKQVSRLANFFELGGHSLLATQLISRVRSHLGPELPLRALFEIQTLAGLAQHIEQLSRENSQLPRPLVRAVKRGDTIPLAYEQEQLWFLAQLEPGSSFYHIPLVLHLEGPLQPAALQASLQDLLTRHESLRTCFQAQDGRPFQVIEPSLTLILPLHDLSELAGDPVAQQEALRQLSQREAETPFELAQAPLLRACLVLLTAEHHCLLLTFHHLIFDGGSLQVLLRELAQGYRAHLVGAGAELPPLPVQYADYALWQREWLQGEVLQRALTSWQDDLSGVPFFLDLPTDRPRVATSRLPGASQSFRLPGALVEGLRTLGRQEQATLYMVLLAGLQIVLQRYSGQADFLLATPVSTRQQEETEALVGMLVNTLVIRADVQGQPSGRRLLERVRERVLWAQGYAELPLEKLVEALRPQRQGGATPLVQVAFAWEEILSGAYELTAALRLRMESWTSRTAKFELTFFAWEDEEGVVGQVEYASSLYEARTIQRLLVHWQQMLESLVALPEQPIGYLPLLTSEEWERQMRTWNQTGSKRLRAEGVQTLVEEQVALHPLACAVRQEERLLTYQELNERANQLAHYLQQQGIGVGACVGVCVPRSLELIVSLLAILKAGAAYVPLDPSYPQQRLETMLQDAQVQVVLTEQALVARLPAGQVASLCVDGLEEVLSSQPRGNLSSLVDASHLAYVMYTSGSTGQPKGIAVTHGSISNLARQPGYVQITSSDVLLHHSSISFDASTFEVWGSLLNGACLVVAPAEQLSLSLMARLISQHRVSIIFLTTALFHQMVDLHLEDLYSLKYLLMGGEVLSVPHVRRAVAGLPDCQVTAVYGPTETTTFACFYPLQKEDSLDSSVPIGCPLEQTRAYVLDEHLQPVPVGVEGELYLGGAGLAQGYLNRPDLTAERFLPDP